MAEIIVNDPQKLAPLKSLLRETYTQLYCNMNDLPIPTKQSEQKKRVALPMRD
jgi:hypothetical protein